MPFIEQVPTPSPPPPSPAIYDTSEHNKENIPPFDFVNQFYLPNIVPEFDTRFKTYRDYRNYIQQRLTTWQEDPDFKQFDGAYCHHRLILRLKEGLQTMHNHLIAQFKELEMQERCQQNNIQLVLPSLQAKGLGLHITETLGRPDLVGDLPFSYPISAWEAPFPSQPYTPTPPPTPAIPIPPPATPLPKRKHNFGDECPKCHRKYLYDHVAWARGLDSGYTCRCPEEQDSPTKASTSRNPLSTTYPSLRNKPCRLCGTNPAHTREFCLEFKCPHCHLYAPEHLAQNCKRRPRKPKRFTKVKEEPQSPRLGWNDDGHGYWDTAGFEDGNLDGEN